MKTSKATTSHSGGPHDMGRDDSPIRAGITVTKLVREHISLSLTPDGTQRLGDMLTDSLTAAALDYQEVHSVEFNIEPEEWRRLAERIRQGYRT